jgi:RNA polymerase sigma factor (sigma-70 family)
VTTSEAAKRRFHEIVTPNLDDAYSLAKWLAGNGSDAEDIVQDAALRALNALDGSTVENPRAWFLRIVRNTALTWIARNRPKSLTLVGDMADLADLGGAPVADPGPGAEEALIASEDSALVRRAIAELPLPLRETLIMREINGLNYRQIAEATATPIGTVMSRLSRARAAIAKAIGGPS